MLSIFSKVPLDLLPSQLRLSKARLENLRAWYAAWVIEHMRVQEEMDQVMQAELERQEDEVHNVQDL